jgi:hypothetical protein
LKPAQANSSKDPISKSPSQKKIKKTIGLVVWLKLKALGLSPVPQKTKQSKTRKPLINFIITLAMPIYPAWKHEHGM